MLTHLVSAALWLHWFVLAQAPVAPGGRVVGGGKTFYVEGAVVVVLFGLAIFAVGRTSRRG